MQLLGLSEIGNAHGRLLQPSVRMHRQNHDGGLLVPSVASNAVMNPDLICFFASGIPKGQPRPRAFAFKGHVRIYSPAQAESWKSQIALAAKEFIPQSPLTGPLRCDLTFYFPRPKSHF